MTTTVVILEKCSVEVLADGERFVGLGQIRIGDTLVRSGRLPLRPYTQTFKDGRELAGLKVLGIDHDAGEIRIRLEASFRDLPVKLMRDHSFDPIHDLGDWDEDRVAGTARLDVVICPATDTFNGVKFEGFCYHYEYHSSDVPLFWIMDSASWELEGDITGATAFSQSSCSAPVAHFQHDTAWSTEGILFFLLDGNQNPVMTHNLPRWASHGSFDFQYKGDKTLIGVFERVELIRSVLLREPGKAELKCFDKHIFDQTLHFSSSAKRILLNTQPKTEAGQKNLWTWVSDEVDQRARAEFGIREEPTIPRIHANFWDNFTIDRYRKDLLPAAIAMGVKQIYIDNIKKSCMTERTPYPGVFNWNMCCNHEFEVSEKLGGVSGVKDFIDDCAKHDIQVMSWTNNDQALSSPLNRKERSDGDSWYILLEDTRQKWGGAYMGCMSALDLGHPEAHKYFVDSHVKVFKETGSHFFYDSFYNLGFMAVSYANMEPRTVWRGLVQTFKEMQDAGIHLLIESFGPWAQAMHGHPASYNMETIFACYKVGMGNDYTTVPGTQQLKDLNPKGADGLYYQLAHKACTGIPMDVDGKRVDLVWGADFKQALADYHAALPMMHRRYLQEDGLSVLWHDAQRQQATLWNFADRKVALPGKVTNLTTGEQLPPDKHYLLRALHTYAITGVSLPTVIEGIEQRHACAPHDVPVLAAI